VHRHARYWRNEFMDILRVDVIDAIAFARGSRAAATPSSR
jgi:hypothetical protein